jgi:hypothetical protein
MQYLIRDPSHAAGPYAGFASGLEFPNGQRKPVYPAYNLPVWMPKTSFSRRAKAEIWGEARPARFERRQTVQIQFSKGSNGPFATISTVKKLSAAGYFDLRMKFPSSGFVRLSFTYNHDPLLPPGVGGSTVTSRVLKIKVR